MAPKTKMEMIVVGPLMTNCYIIHADGEALVIDPGWEGDVIVDKLEKLKVEAKYLVATHLHTDHINGAKEVIDRYDPDWLYHEKEEELWELLPMMARRFGLKHPELPHATRYLEEGDEIELAGDRFKVLLTPGHSPGSISLLGDGVIYDGDLLFDGSIGRTDFEYGSFDVLKASIKEKVYVLDDKVKVYPGHGPMTTVGIEKKQNMFVRG
jgi:glyoxylase-like metal-dependent hydrolase (beta-lactamase superfamily II)